MADDMNLEAAEPVAPPAPAEPAAPATPPDPDEAVAIDTPSGKVVPLSALKAVRDELKALKPKAERVDQLEGWVNQNKPVIDFIQQNPQILRPQQTPQAPAGPAQPDPQLVNIARSLDFVKANGELDLDRARQHQQLVRDEARSIAQEIVAPLAMNTYQDKANQNWQQAVQERLPNGQPIDVNLLTTAWREVARQNPAIVSDPRAVRVIVNSVLMEQMRANPMLTNQPRPPANPPIVTENLGNKPRNGNTMNDTQRAIVANRGIDDAKFADLTKTFTPGRMNILED